MDESYFEKLAAAHPSNNPNENPEKFPSPTNYQEILTFLETDQETPELDKWSRGVFEHRKLVEFLSSNPEMRILDLGFGGNEAYGNEAGTPAARAIKLFRAKRKLNTQITNLDISPHAFWKHDESGQISFRHSEQKQKGDDYVLADATHTPFRENTFDLVTFRWVLTGNPEIKSMQSPEESDVDFIFPPQIQKGYHTDLNPKIEAVIAKIYEEIFRVLKNRGIMLESEGRFLTPIMLSKPMKGLHELGYFKFAADDLLIFGKNVDWRDDLYKE